MRDTSAGLLPGMRVCSCGWRPISPEGVAVTRTAKGYGVGGLRVCGSVWTCPVCAVKVAATRTADLIAAIGSWHARGGHVLMLTLTIRHTKHDELAANLDAMTRAMRALWSGRWGGRFRSRYGVAGLVRNLEATWGAANGWHPHAHVLLFVRELAEVEAMRAELADRWVAVLERVGLEASLERGVDLQVEPPKPAAGELREIREYDEILGEYVTKMVSAEAIERAWTAAHEVAWSHIKRTRGDRFTPWMLLALAGRANELVTDGDEPATRAPALWQEFAAAFFGRRQLYWSKGLRALLALEVELDDEAIAEAGDDDAVFVARVPPRTWYWLRKHQLVPAMLDYAEEWGDAGATEYIDEAMSLATARAAPYAWMQRASDMEACE